MEVVSLTFTVTWLPCILVKVRVLPLMLFRVPTVPWRCWKFEAEGVDDSPGVVGMADVAAGTADVVGTEDVAAGTAVVDAGVDGEEQADTAMAAIITSVRASP
jgi:hypothetical protein